MILYIPNLIIKLIRNAYRNPINRIYNNIYMIFSAKLYMGKYKLAL